jgi:hypothetical protein
MTCLLRASCRDCLLLGAASQANFNRRGCFHFSCPLLFVCILNEWVSTWKNRLAGAPVMSSFALEETFV